MATPRSLMVLLPRGSRAEAEAARGALSQHGLKLVFGTGSAHTAGQTINGDVLVVGNKPSTLEADVTGRVWHLDDLAALNGFDPDVKKKAPLAEPATPESPRSADVEHRKVGHVEHDAVTTPQSDEVIKPDERDDLDGMNRVELIQHAAQHHPGQRQWATMTNDKLRETIRELRD